ncbi:MAG: PP2C family serine/threonine-protein phosphatase [Chloroflexota bacterium]
MSRYEIRLHQFGLISGVRQEVSDLISIAEPTALFSTELRKGRLYIITEANPEAVRGQDACRLVSRTIRKVFYEDRSYSVTAALRKAVTAANSALYQHNFNVTPQKRAVVGVTCAVLKENDLYVAQVMPSQGYVLSAGNLRALPPTPSWSGGQEQIITPLLKPSSLGTSLSIEAEFYRSVMRPGDSVLFCSSNLSRMLGRDDVMQLLRQADPVSAIKEINTICKDNSVAEAHGLVLFIAPPLSPAAAAEPLSRAGITERGRMLVQSVGDGVSRMTSEIGLMFRSGDRAKQRKTAMRHEHAQRENEQLHTMPDEPPPMPSTTISIPPLELGESLEERVEHERREQGSQLGAPPPRPIDSGLPPSAFLGEGAYYAPPLPVERRVDLSDTPSMAAVGNPKRVASQPEVAPLSLDMTWTERALQPFEKLADTITKSNRRRRLRRPPPSAMPQVPRRPGLSYRREGPPFPWLLLLLLVTLVALLVVYGMNLSNQNAQRQANDLLVEAEQAVAALRTSDEAAAQQQLAVAESALERVRASSIVTATEENRQLLTLIERDYERQLAIIRRLTYFDDITELGRHPQAAANATFSTLVVPPPPEGTSNTDSFESLYLVDSNAGVLYQMPKEGGTPEPFLRPNDQLGEGRTVGSVRSAAWRLDNIIAVTQNEGGPFVYYFRNGNSWSASNLGGSDEWNQSINEHFKIVTYDGNLYIWGARPGQILRYSSGRVGDLYEPWISNETEREETAVDVAIDGNVYLLKPDGSILVYFQNAFERELTLPSVDPPLVAVTSFVVTGTSDTGYIFLIDTQNERIIQIDKQTGDLIQQIRVRPDGSYRLDQLIDVQVDMMGARPTLYIVNGSQVLRAMLPEPPPSLSGGGDTDTTDTSPTTTP